LNEPLTTYQEKGAVQALQEVQMNLDRYPIDRLDGIEGRNLLSRSRAAFAAEGVLMLAEFVRVDTLAKIVEEVRPLRLLSYSRPHQANAYLSPADEKWPDKHGRNLSTLTNLSVVADDQIPSASGIRSFYVSPILREFLAKVLGYPALFPYADSLGSLNINFAGSGQQLGWHFDNSDFAATLLLQVAERGGAFEYVPHARTAADPGYAKVASAIGGDRSIVRVLNQEPGALVLFRGRHALHRVTVVEGEIPRIIAVLAYDTEPGVQLTEFNRKLLYGRLV
jgi:hypothetical protein